MRLSILTAGIILIAISTAPSVGYAAGQPQIRRGFSAAATGKTGDQAEKNKMEIKKERDAKKYQSPGGPAKTEK